ncbi:hypothetical protein [Chitinimonas lacunae]|uniref:Uncharacterized protein n=1 Tax=Chitinimonas lacunae TaxID=1963018 RepID=A0ABV8MXA0_9NEIS
MARPRTRPQKPPPKAAELVGKHVRYKTHRAQGHGVVVRAVSTSAGEFVEVVETGRTDPIRVRPSQCTPTE